jgi:hypothetical protein
MRRVLSVVAVIALAAGAAACVDPATTGHNSTALKVIDGPEDVVACTRWQNGYLVVSCNTTLSRVHVKGGLYVEASNVTVRDSIVEGGAAWFIIVMVPSGTLVVEDVTARWKGGDGAVNPNTGNGAGVVQMGAGGNLTVRRSNLSGNPDGIQCAGTCLVEDTWIHDLAMVGTWPNNTHNDGVQFYAGNLTVRNSMLDTGAESPYSNAAIFLQGAGINCVSIEGDTWLNGGGYTFYAQHGLIDLNDTRFGPDHLWGEKLVQSPAREVADC